MKYGAIVPHLKTKNGGLRRFVEIAKEFNNKGHDFFLFTPDLAQHKEWGIKDAMALKDRIDLEYCLIGDPTMFGEVSKVTGKTWVYVIGGGEVYGPMYSKMYGKLPFIVNNRKFLKEYPDATLIEGGVGSQWKPKELRVGFSTKKSPEAVSLKEFPHIKLIPMEGMTDRELLVTYRTLDYFVSWEKFGGWSNMAAEALACGVTVVTNGVNCEPFLDKCIVSKNLMETFNPLAGMTYKDVADKLLSLWTSGKIWSN